MNSIFSNYTGNSASNDKARKKYNLPKGCMISCTFDCEKLGPCKDKYSMAGVHWAKGQSEIIVRNDTFIGNEADSSCGLMDIENSTLHLIDSFIKKSVSEMVAGNISHSDSSNISLVNSTFIENRAFDTIIALSNSHVEIKNCIFIDSLLIFVIEDGYFLRNILQNNGNLHDSLLYFVDTMVTINRSIFYDNDGGLVGKNGTLKLQNCLFNRTGGKMFYMSHGNVSVHNSNFTGIKKYSIFASGTYNGYMWVSKSIFSDIETPSTMAFSNANVSVIVSGSEIQQAK